ncbi:ATP-binding protein [Wenjunlia tyrosinilytica]|uniref:LuxR family transcriptional regulator n=1 Tax=Wenjunlia tyrosinilytica TaxID=1544741 RepID=A0A917ZZD4_9ACTN|nr:LuxR family transcriptional regulator [Wenjunlia tyrosinilytica]GGP00011.1 LuxR family transcriptional regulator [Wenjunlia tyrosinilytica]
MNHPGFLERARETAAIDDLLTDAAAGAGRVLLVSGVVGSGKTAVLEAAIAEARSRGFTVLVTRGSFPERGVPFGLLRRLVCHASRQLGDEALADARPQVPAPRGEKPATQGRTDAQAPADDDWQAEFRLVHGALRLLAARAPVLIAIDDVQWVDGPSLRWLSTVPRRVENDVVAVVCTLGDGEQGAEPAMLDEFLATRPQELRPAALSTTAAAALLEGTLPVAPEPSLVTACHNATGGNPLLMTALATALTEHGTAAVDDATIETADLGMRTLASTLHARLRRTSPHGLALTHAVAALGPDATVERVTELLGIDQATVAQTAVVLERMGLLSLTEQRVDFAQPLVRHTITQEIPFSALHELRARAARLLRAARLPQQRVVEQLMAIPMLGEPWAAEELRSAAATALAGGSPATAVSYLRRALSEPDGSGPDLLADLGMAEAYTDVVAATQHLSDALGHPGLGERDDAARRALVDVRALAGHYRAAIDLVANVPAERASDWEPRLVALRLGHTCGAAEAVRALDRWSRSPVGQGPTVVRSLALLAAHESWMGESRTRALALADRVLAVAPSCPDAVQPYASAVLVLAQAGFLPAARERCDALITATGRWQHRPSLAAAHSLRSAVARLHGPLPLAVEDARSALRIMDGCGLGRRTPAAIEALARLVEALVDTDAIDEAAGLLEFSQLTDEVPQTWAGAMLLMARGRLRTAAGHPSCGARDMQDAADRLTAWSVGNPAVAPWRSELALAAHALGDHAGAGRLAAMEVELARQWGAAGPLGRALRCHALVVGGPSGLAMSEESASVLEHSGYRPELARALTDYGAALNRANRPAQARRSLRSALDLTERFPSPVLAERAGAELAAAGGRQRRTRRAGIAGLTAAERRTASLAATGRTNREIAEKLFVHRRTVELHLTSVYRKLGIRGRDQLPSAMGIPDPAPSSDSSGVVTPAGQVRLESVG